MPVCFMASKLHSFIMSKIGPIIQASQLPRELLCVCVCVVTCVFKLELKMFFSEQVAQSVLDVKSHICSEGV